jgi:pimeloyl-ACP methyl ester carboxylesterase
MDHLGIDKFFFMGYCFGDSFAMKLLQRAPGRVVGAILCQTAGHHPDHPAYMFTSGLEVWAPKFLARRPDVDKTEIEPYLHRLYRGYPDFIYSVIPEFAQSCQTPILVRLAIQSRTR